MEIQNSTILGNNIEKIRETMKELQNSMDEKFEQFMKKFELLMNARKPDFSMASKSEPEHHRRVLICGSTEEYDCLCVGINSTRSVYYDVVDHYERVFTLEEKRSCTEHDQSVQPIMISQEELGVKDAGQVFDKMRITDMDKDASRFVKNDFGDAYPLQILASAESLKPINSSSINRQVGIEGFYVDNELFDKCSKVDGYIAEPNPKPPDDYRQLIQCGTTEFKLDFWTVKPTDISENYEGRFVAMDAQKVFDKRPTSGTSNKKTSTN